jgi:hypothetical protein
LTLAKASPAAGVVTLVHATSRVNVQVPALFHATRSYTLAATAAAGPAFPEDEFARMFVITGQTVGTKYAPFHNGTRFPTYGTAATVPTPVAEEGEIGFVSDVLSRNCDGTIAGYAVAALY